MILTAIFAIKTPRCFAEIQNTFLVKVKLLLISTLNTSLLEKLLMLLLSHALAAFFDY
jgi:hypothetical protein